MFTIQSLLVTLVQVDTICQEVLAILIMAPHQTIIAQAVGHFLEQPVIPVMVLHVIHIIHVLLEDH